MNGDKRRSKTCVVHRAHHRVVPVLSCHEADPITPDLGVPRSSSAPATCSGEVWHGFEVLLCSSPVALLSHVSLDVGTVGYPSASLIFSTEIQVNPLRVLYQLLILEEGEGGKGLKLTFASFFFGFLK